jgi:hypothetical protein
MGLKIPEITTELTLFCPRRDCSHYQTLDNSITKDGTYLWPTSHRFTIQDIAVVHQM